MTRAGEDRGGLAHAFTRITDGVSRLVSEHLALARVELRQDARTFGVEAAKIAVFLPAILVGYALLCVAAALGLAHWLGQAWAFALVGFVNFAGGALGAALAARKLGKTQVLEGTRAEVERTSTVLAQAAKTHGANGAEKRLGA